MSEPTNQELKELILLSVSELEKKMDVGFESVRGEIKRLDEKIEGRVARLEEKINGLDSSLRGRQKAKGKRQK
ncbi:MAG: hypothetical protein AB4426_07170 [Xenococcaceae cyanobacterium]